MAFLGLSVLEPKVENWSLKLSIQQEETTSKKSRVKGGFYKKLIFFIYLTITDFRFGRTLHQRQPRAAAECLRCRKGRLCKVKDVVAKLGKVGQQAEVSK